MRVSRLNGQYEVHTTFVTITVGSAVQVLEADPERWAVIFATPSGGANVLAFAEPTLTRGMPVTPNTGSVGFDAAKFPALPSGQWMAFGTSAGILTIVSISQTRNGE